MPTPSPIIVARAGAVVGTSATWLISVTTLSPSASPRIAVAIGIPIATAVPKVNSRITTAARSPTITDISVDGFETFWPR